MRELVFVFMVFFGLSSCNQEEIENLNNKVELLDQENEELNSHLEQMNYRLSESIKEGVSIESLQYELKACKEEYNEYRYGSHCCLTRGGHKVCGADNVIDFLNDHYKP